MKQDIASLRAEYTRTVLEESLVASDPMVQFEKWFQEAVAAEVTEPNAMTLATADAQGIPSARMVLLKGLEHGGFAFYTHYESQKGRELSENPYAALVFWWAALERQVRVAGSIRQLPSAISDAYFATRPRGSQIGAWASQQSAVLSSRADLESEEARLTAEFSNATVIPRPPNWGGYLLVPKEVEFWQGRPSRLHDRIRYTNRDGAWQLARLSP